MKLQGITEDSDLLVGHLTYNARASNNRLSSGMGPSIMASSVKLTASDTVL
jgi:hypothetical protein